MDINDFKGLNKYKIIIPLVYFVNWISMIAGPYYFPQGYMNFFMIVMVYVLYKVLMMFTTMIIVFVQAWKNMNKLKDTESGKSYSSLVTRVEQINYGFIIPNYKQEIQLLCETLDVLAAHKRAKSSYLIFLAMQAHEEGSEQKAQTLIKKYQSFFRVIDFTRHEIRPNQQKGKASNVSWCAEHLEPIFQKHMISPDSVMLTIMDADSWAPDLYFDVLQQKINKQYDQRHIRIYQPTQIFTRNNLDVPIVTRVYDILHSFAHTSMLYSCIDITYSLSNYTLSYNLAKRIGFWDTCPDAIGEDFHTTMKAVFKTKAEVKTKPIYVPFNQVNICTGNGYWADVKARFWQAERHAKGVADVAYCLDNVRKQPSIYQNYVVFLFVLEAFILAATLPWFLFSNIFQKYVVFPNPSDHPEYVFTDEQFQFLMNLISFFGTIPYLMFEIIKRRANRIIYKQENESIFRVLQYLILYLPIFMTVSVPTFIIASFRTYMGKSQYIVAEKKASLKQTNSH